MRGNMIQAIVSEVHKEGFISASLEESVGDVPKGTHITFSKNVWLDRQLPQKGQKVEFPEIHLFRGGWRALKVYPIKLQKKQS